MATTIDATVEATLLDIVDAVLYSGTQQEATLGQTWGELAANESQMLLIAYRVGDAFAVSVDADDRKLFYGGCTLEGTSREIRIRMKART